MEFTALGRTGIQISRIGFGTANLVPGFAGTESRLGERIAAMYLDVGGNFFDTADTYGAGLAETTLGKLLQGHRRSSVIISSKVGWPSGDGPNEWGLSRKHVLDSIEGSLRRLGTDYVDLYQMHLYDDATPIEETLEALDDCVHAGKIRYVGASSFFAWQLARANGIARLRNLSRIESMQTTYNLLRRDIEREHVGYCQAEGVGLIVYSPFHGGLLAGAITGDEIPPTSRMAIPQLRRMYMGDDEERSFRVVDVLNQVARQQGYPPAAVSLAWLLRRPSVSSVLIGPELPGELVEDLSAFDVELDSTSWSDLDAVSHPSESYPSDFYGRLSDTYKYMRDSQLASLANLGTGGDEADEAVPMNAGGKRETEARSV